MSARDRIRLVAAGEAAGPGSTTPPDPASRLSAGHDGRPEPTRGPEDTGLALTGRRPHRHAPGAGARPHRRLLGRDEPGASRRRCPLRDQRGFTLIELLVVIIVLGLLVGLVGPRLFGRVGQSRTAAARAQIELFGAALDQYRLDVGSYPTTSQGLEALDRNPGAQNWNGPYLKKALPKDPWGNPYKYRCCPGQHGEYDLWSEGADAAPGGEGENADVTSWGGEQR